MIKLPNWLRRIVLPNPYERIVCTTGFRPQLVTHPAPKTFNIRSMLVYGGGQLIIRYDIMQKLLDDFVIRWAKFKLGVNLQISGSPILYQDFLPLDPEDKYGIALLYNNLQESYSDKDLWLVYAPFYTPRTRDLWAGFYDMNKMVFNTFIDNFTYKDETYVISEELLHAILDKLGYSYQVSVEKVHANRSAGIADFFDMEGNFVTSGNTRDIVPDSYFITVGGNYP